MHKKFETFWKLFVALEASGNKRNFSLPQNYKTLWTEERIKTDLKLQHLQFREAFIIIPGTAFEVYFTAAFFLFECILNLKCCRLGWPAVTRNYLIENNENIVCISWEGAECFPSTGEKLTVFVLLFVCWIIWIKQTSTSSSKISYSCVKKQ